MRNVTRKIEQYRDIINLPRPEPRCCPRMPLEKRAAQFAPFAALTGYEEVVSRFFRKFISSASKYRHQMYGFSSSAGCSISILNRCSMSI